MKKIYTVLFFYVLFQGCGIYQQSVGLDYASPLKNTKTHITYEEVVNHSKTKEEVYTSMKLWFTENFKNANYVVQFDDKELGKLTGKGTFAHTPPVHYGSGPIRGDISFIIDLSIKDDKYRIKVYDFNHKGTSYYSTATKSHVVAIDMGILKDCDYPECATSKKRKFVSENWILFHNEALIYGTEIIKSIKDRVESKGGDDW